MSNLVLSIADDLYLSKVETSITRLQTLEPAVGYYFADSGGKDSCVCRWLLQQAGVKVDAHHHLTTVDPPELVRFVKQHHPDTLIEKPELTMWQLIAKNKYPPTRIQRYCCRELKERGGKGRVVVTGVRWAESARRAKRRMVEQCQAVKSKMFVHPIIDWSDADVWRCIHENDIPYCSLYDEGFTRLGCIMCPMQPERTRAADAARWPQYAAAYKRAFQKAIDNRDNDVGDWQTADEMYEWWVHGVYARPKKGEEDEQTLFEW